MALLPSVVHEWHEGPVKALDAAGSVIASGGADGVVRMMAVSGEHRGSYRHSDLVNAVAVRPDGAVASGSRDRTIRLWQPAHERSYEVGAHDHWVMCIAWSPTGDQLVTGSEDGTLAFWDPDGAGVSRVDADYTVNGVDWKGDLVAAATGDRRLLLLTGGEIRREIRGATQMLWSTALSPDGHTVAWTGRDRRLWLAPVDGEATAVPAHRNQVWAVTWHPTGEALFTASADRTVAKWSPDGDEIDRVRLPAWARRAVFINGSLYVAAEDGSVHVFEDDVMAAPPPRVIEIPETPASCPHWDPQVEETSKDRCEECGSTEELRLCVTCGHVGCCESQLAHGTKHWVESGHPNTTPAAPGPLRWKWCYQDDMYVKRVG